MIQPEYLHPLVMPIGIVHEHIVFEGMADGELADRLDAAGYDPWPFRLVVHCFPADVCRSFGLDPSTPYVARLDFDFEEPRIRVVYAFGADSDDVVDAVVGYFNAIAERGRPPLTDEERLELKALCLAMDGDLTAKQLLTLVAEFESNS